MKKKLKSKKFSFIPVNKPLITKEDISYLNKSISKGWISSEGPEVRRFENNFSNFLTSGPSEEIQPFDIDLFR